MFAATFVTKYATEDTEENGSRLDTTHCVMSESLDITRDGLNELLSALKEHFCYPHDYFVVRVDEELGESWVEWNQHENGGGDSLDTWESKELWSQGKKVYLCDYTVSIEARESRHVDKTDFIGAQSGAVLATDSKPFQLEFYE